MTQPNITISSNDFDKVHELLDDYSGNSDYSLLLDELERANVVSMQELPNNIVKMNSIVTFTILESQQSFSLKLVYPEDTAKEGTISILSPVGSALLGLSIGQMIEWPLSSNQKTMVRIDTVA